MVGTFTMDYKALPPRAQVHCLPCDIYYITIKKGIIVVTIDKDRCTAVCKILAIYMTKPHMHAYQFGSKYRLGS